MTTYRKLPGMNQSLLKKILDGPQAFKKALQSMYEPSDSTAFRFGTLLDIMITEPDTDIESIYAIQPDIEITDTIKPILNEAARRRHSGDDTLIEIADELAYCASMKPLTRLTRIKVEGWEEYINFKVEAADKTVITLEEYNQALVCKMSLISNEYTKKYFESTPNIEVLRKVVIQETRFGIDFKYELDMVVINHTLKVIFPVDIKTIGENVYAFSKNFWRYRYDFQAVMYQHACNGHFKNLIDQDYSIDNFRFIVCEKQSINNPLVYRVTDETLTRASIGGEVPAYKKEGLKQAIERYNWHTTTDKWDYPMEYYLTGYLEI
jgi:hypothetical protein